MARLSHLILGGLSYWLCRCWHVSTWTEYFRAIEIKRVPEPNNTDFPSLRLFQLILLGNVPQLSNFEPLIWHRLLRRLTKRIGGKGITLGPFHLGRGRVSSWLEWFHILNMGFPLLLLSPICYRPGRGPWPQPSGRHRAADTQCG